MEKEVLRIIAIGLGPVLKKSRYFELFVDTDKGRENLLNYSNIGPWTYSSSESNLFRKKIFCLMVACSSPLPKLSLLG